MNGWVGRTLSKVRIERLLGRGGMAEIYLGTHSTLDRQVAVKILHAHLQDDEDLQRRFMAEARAVAQLRHPNIVQVYDFDLVDGRPYIVMELLQGTSLAAYLRGLHASGLTLPFDTVCRLTDGIAAALDYAHGRGVVHRDVKPANIMLRQGAQPVDPQLPLLPQVQPILTDFGVARLTNTTHQTATGTVLGTPAYMSPEQVRGETIDGRSDIYSLGIVVYEMLAGEPPFNHDTTPAAVLMKQLQDPPPPVPQAPASIQAVIDRALAKAPADRFPSASELAGALRAASQAAVEPAAPTQLPPARPAPRQRRSRVIWVAVGLVVLFFCMAGVGGAALGVRAWMSRPTPTAQLAAGPAKPIDAPSTAVSTAAAAGTALFGNTGISGELSGATPPPSGSGYVAWLMAADGSPHPLGPLAFQDSRLDLTFQDPDWLASGANGLAISLEPLADQEPTQPTQIVYRAEFSPGVQTQLALLSEVAGPGPLVDLVEWGLGLQVVHFSSHQGYVIESIAQSDLPAAQQHSEHVINISEGRGGPDYGDWNGDGRVENPGDDFGLIPYLQLLRTLIEGSASPSGAIDTIDPLIDDVGRARDLATRIAAADTLEEVQPLSDELASYQLTDRVNALLNQVGTADLHLAVELQAASD
jgi:tRNA A-37 threonylcarbamoyl transferase component Bud32